MAYELETLAPKKKILGAKIILALFAFGYLLIWLFLATLTSTYFFAEIFDLRPEKLGTQLVRPKNFQV